METMYCRRSIEAFPYIFLNLILAVKKFPSHRECILIISPSQNTVASSVACLLYFSAGCLVISRFNAVAEHQECEFYIYRVYRMVHQAVAKRMLFRTYPSYVHSSNCSYENIRRKMRIFVLKRMFVFGPNIRYLPNIRPF